MQGLLKEIRDEICAGLIERAPEIDLCLVGLICGQNVLMVGPPGCAKSMAANAMCAAVKGRKYSILMTKTTTPEEVFGPISINALKNESYARNITGRAADAEILFLDEIWKSSSAILNGLLKILNERQFDNDGKSIDVPLQLCIAASNEWPSEEGGKELGALFDRFLLRKEVRPIVTAAGKDRLLWAEDISVNLTKTISKPQIKKAQEESLKIPWTVEAKDAFHLILKTAKEEGIIPGDRRLRASVRATQGFAYLNGSQEVTTDDLEILCHTMWEDPKEQPKVIRKIVQKAANPEGMRINELLMEAEQIVEQTDTSDWKKTAASVGKLREVARSLGKLKSSRAKEAKEHLVNRVKDLKANTMEMVE